MTRDESNYYSMLLATKGILDEHPEYVKSIPALFESAQGLDEKIIQIEFKDDEYLNLPKGSSQKKRDLENELRTHAFALCCSLYVLGRKNNDSKICEIVDINQSEFTKLKGVLLINKGKKVKELLDTHADKLGAFGTTAEDITKFNTVLKDCDEANTKRKTLKTGSVSSRQELKIIFDNTNTMMREELDKLMEVVKLKNINFFNKYKNARQIIDLGGGHPGGGDTPPPPPSGGDSGTGNNPPASGGNNSGGTTPATPPIK
jgi:hypothetical protein